MADRRLAWALVAAIVRYLTTIQPHARRELARWRQRAHAIPNPDLRRQILRPFDADRSPEGAALFAVLEPAQRHDLIPLLIAYVLLWSCVDAMTERAEPLGEARLFEALVDALSPEQPLRADMYGGDDHGYLAALVRVCKERCGRLPSWGVVGPPARRLARHGEEVQRINHGPRHCAEQRLRAWAHADARDPSARWQDLCAGASSPLAIHALIALGGRSDATAAQASATTAAYFPSFSALGVVADHLVDRTSDASQQQHSYLAYFGDPATMARSMRRLAESSARGVRTLARSERHAVILAAMVAMFSTEEGAQAADNAPAFRAMLEAVDQPASLLARVITPHRRPAARPPVG